MYGHLGKSSIRQKLSGRGAMSDMAKVEEEVGGDMGESGWPIGFRWYWEERFPLTDPEEITIWQGRQKAALEEVCLRGRSRADVGRGMECSKRVKHWQGSNGGWPGEERFPLTDGNGSTGNHIQETQLWQENRWKNVREEVFRGLPREVNWSRGRCKGDGMKRYIKVDRFRSEKKGIFIIYQSIY